LSVSVPILIFAPPKEERGSSSLKSGVEAVEYNRRKAVLLVRFIRAAEE